MFLVKTTTWLNYILETKRQYLQTATMKGTALKLLFPEN